MEQNLPPPPVPVSIKSSRSNKRFLPIIGLILIVGVVASGLLFYFKRAPGPRLQQAVKEDRADTNYLPQTGLAGTIEQINGDQLTISEMAAKKATYKINITPETTITVIPPIIPYSVKIATPSANFKATVKDLKVGQVVNITSKSDLKKLILDQFEASSITASSQPIIIEVTIDEVSEGQLIAIAGPPSVAETKKYKILFNKGTEIVRSAIFDDSTKPVKKSQLSASNLEPGRKIIVYTDSDINSLTLNALKIDIIPTAP